MANGISPAEVRARLFGQTERKEMKEDVSARESKVPTMPLRPTLEDCTRLFQALQLRNQQNEVLARELAERQQQNREILDATKDELVKSEKRTKKVEEGTKETGKKITKVEQQQKCLAVGIGLLGAGSAASGGVMIAKGLVYAGATSVGTGTATTGTAAAVGCRNNKTSV